jgi:hypothetical protein
VITIILGLSVFLLAVLLLGIGLITRGRPLRSGCGNTCALSGRCPLRTSSGCPYREERADE